MLCDQYLEHTNHIHLVIINSYSCLYSALESEIPSSGLQLWFWITAIRYG